MSLQLGIFAALNFIVQFVSTKILAEKIEEN